MRLSGEMNNYPFVGCIRAVGLTTVVSMVGGSRRERRGNDTNRVQEFHISIDFNVISQYCRYKLLLYIFSKRD